MEIQTTAPLSSISLSNVVRAASGSGRISFPVDSTTLVYTNFKNIKTVPSSGDTGTYSVSRLRALDNLIEQLNRMKELKGWKFPEINKMETPELDSLISELSDRIHSGLQTNRSFKTPIDTSGLLFNLMA